MAEGFFDTEAAETGEELLYKTTGVQDKVFKKLRRGQFAVTAELGPARIHRAACQGLPVRLS